MLNKKASFKLTAVLILLAVTLLAYGYYGYIMVPGKTMSVGGMKCPFSFGQQPFGFQSGPCLYSLYALIAGGILLAGVILLTIFKK